MNSRSFVVCLFLTALAAAGCSKGVPEASDNNSAKPVEPVRPPPAAIDASPPALDPAAFKRFVIKNFNWEIQGYDILEVHADGKVMMLEAVGYREKYKGEDLIVAKWHRVDWLLSTAELEVFRAELTKSKFGELSELYIDRGVDDGQNVEFILTTAGGEHRVQCSNKFPPEIVLLRKWAQKAMTPHRKNLRSSSKPILRKDAEAIWSAY